MADMPLSRMFDLFWVQRSSDNAFALDMMNGPEDRPLNLLVVDGKIEASWRYDSAEVSIEPDTIRWMATRMMEAAVLADCQQSGLLLEWAEPEPEVEYTGMSQAAVDYTAEKAIEVSEARHGVPRVEHVLEGLDPEDPLGSLIDGQTHYWDEGTQQWLKRP